MKIKIEIVGVTFKDVEEEGDKKFELESDSFDNFNEVAKCILKSGYWLKAYILFGCD
jgi:hypothetical protein